MHDQRNTRDPKELKLKVAEYPAGFHGDVADLLNTPGGPELFGAMLRNARPGPSWMIEHVDDVGGHDLSTVDGRVAATEDLVDVLLHQPPIARAKYVAELAEKLGEPVEAIRETLDEALELRRAHYVRHPNERPWRRQDPDGEVGMEIPI